VPGLLAKRLARAHSGQVTENPDARGGGPAPDLEYDLAHEAGVADRAGANPPAGRQHPPIVYVATETTGYDGDYGYDLAHDVPRT
jgi:hypothetical protein